MILLITSCARGEECAEALQKSTGERTKVIKSLQRSSNMLVDAAAAENITAVVIDEVLLESEPAHADELLNRVETAIPVFINLAISGIERVGREVRLALQRHQRERLLAIQAAERMLRSEVKGTLTGILLSSQLALEVPSVPETAQAKMRSVYELALGLRSRLEPETEMAAMKRAR